MSSLAVSVAVVAAVVLASQVRRADAVDCSSAPDCAALLRQPCDTTQGIGNACGDCLPSAHGGRGPTNTACLRNDSCAVVFPAQDGCPAVGGLAPKVPFIVPFGRCTCDRQGWRWPTAPNRCAQIIVRFPFGAGIFELQQCSTTTCDPATCITLAEWQPGTAAPSTFACARKGMDSVLLSDACAAVQGLPLTASARCGHYGMIAGDLGGTANFPVDCVVAPKCPHSVLDDTKLDQTCCLGTHYSHPIVNGAIDYSKAAPGFCQAQVGANADGKCSVRTSASNWRGCACLDSDGLTTQRTCTVECTLPECLDKGIAPTPKSWQSSEVSPNVYRDRSQLQGVATVSAAAPPPRAAAAALPAALLALLAAAAAPRQPSPP